MDTLSRRIRILQMIPRKSDGSITAPQIRRKLNSSGHFGEISARTIERDLQALSETFDIDHDDGARPYHWYWYGNEVVDIPAMGRDTALAFLLARDYLKPLLPRAALSSLRNHFQRAEQTLKDDSTSAAQWRKRVRIVPRYFHPLPATVPSAVLHAVDQALYEQRQLEVMYHSLERIRNGKPPRLHRLNPVMLAYRNTYSELLAYTDRRVGLNRFVLHRIRKARVLDSHVSRNPPWPVLEREIERRMAWPEDGRMIRLKAWIDAGDAYHVLDTPLHKDQELEHREDGIIVTASVRLTGALIWWILGMGAKMRIIEPPELREKIRDIIERMAEQYR